MSDEQKMAGAIADAVLNTPEPDRYVDCGEARPLPMFHMATLMQYGERCAEAALAYARSQQEPVAWQEFDKDGAYLGVTDAPVCNWTLKPLFASPPVPHGWKLVPKEPTKEMCEAAGSLPALNIGDAQVQRLSQQGWLPYVVANRQKYLAMLSAALKPEDVK